MFPTFEMFCQVMDQCTENYECLVINNNAKSNKLEDQVFWYKADAHNNFQIGSKKFWKHHSSNFNNSYNNIDAPNTDYPGKKKKQFINVKKLNQYS